MRYSNYALEKGYIPVVDFKNMPNNMIEENEVGKVNGWESLFEQPAGYTLKEALQSKNRIIKDCHGNGSQQNIEKREVPWDIDWNDKKSVDYWMKVHELIKIKRKIQEEIDRKYVSLFSKKDRVLGVKIRGTDYTLNKPYGHPIQPPVEDVIALTKKIRKDYNCNKIFLGCEDKEIQELFKVELGEEAVVTGEIGIKLEKKNTCMIFMQKIKLATTKIIWNILPIRLF